MGRDVRGQPVEGVLDQDIMGDDRGTRAEPRQPGGPLPVVGVFHPPHMCELGQLPCAVADV